ncbi:Hypothetical protein Trvi_ORF124 [Trabala vishnou gigantina nucleopolyhedrovirus]|uniref:Hypothetical protein n=1 Tax=Trabala vishnou gigantina nucleopolyhedrovirus TaxID=2863583 RepID=UPI002481D350|nr:Hypothetical protein QKU87_gp124 [Trabala vishnou gigantina nucleopolyhedrovirus]QYC92750.1 Hypothetical protein Trvi_ORF124 [Trabala vishnou gigantina nucleopolyhedrovirus]
MYRINPKRVRDNAYNTFSGAPDKVTVESIMLDHAAIKKDMYKLRSQMYEVCQHAVGTDSALCTRINDSIETGLARGNFYNYNNDRNINNNNYYRVNATAPAADRKAIDINLIKTSSPPVIDVIGDSGGGGGGGGRGAIGVIGMETVARM